MWDVASVQLTSFALKAAGAIVVWIVGRYLIALAVRLVSAAATRQKVDPTILRYLASAVTVTLNVILVVAILGYFGVETTSFAALLAAAGIAIGAAWAGLLSNFAGGAFLIVLRPFKVGDYVKVGGVEGTVTEIGLFASTILTPDNVTTFVGNGKIFGDTISNYSASTWRRVDREAQLAHSVNPQDAIARLRTALMTIPNVEKSPAPTVEIIDFNERGTRLAVRPYTHTDHYWQVYFDTNRVISETFGAAGYPVPEAHVLMGQKPVALPVPGATPAGTGTPSSATAVA
nr:mechanosensitive ion channel family protein [Azohydromonas aeria]